MTRKSTAGHATNSRFNALGSQEPPSVRPELDQSRRLELLLSRAYGVLPFLAEMLAVDDAIDRVIAKVGMDGLNQGMLFHGSQWPVPLQEIQNRLAENGVSGATGQAQVDELVFGDSSLLLELRPKSLGDARRLLPERLANAIGRFAE